VLVGVAECGMMVLLHWSLPNNLRLSAQLKSFTKSTSYLIYVHVITKNTKKIIFHVIATTLQVFIIISPTIGSILNPLTPRTPSTRGRCDEPILMVIIIIRSRPSSLLDHLHLIQHLPTHLILDQHQLVDSPTTLRMEVIVGRWRLCDWTSDLHHTPLHIHHHLPCHP